MKREKYWMWDFHCRFLGIMFCSVRHNHKFLSIVEKSCALILFLIKNLYLNRTKIDTVTIDCNKVYSYLIRGSTIFGTFHKCKSSIEACNKTWFISMYSARKTFTRVFSSNVTMRYVCNERSGIILRHLGDGSI